jgi:PKD repeat protein
MPPQITCPHCGNTINLENRKEVDFEKITYALNNSPKTFTELLEITNLPRKTLSLRLKDLCTSGSIVKDGGYRLSTSFKSNGKISGIKGNGKGRMKGAILRMGKNVQWIPVGLIICLVAVAFGSAIMISPHQSSSAPPIARFFYAPSQNTFAGSQLTFFATLSRPSNGPLTDYAWDYGDGTPLAYGQIVTHAYMTEGTYTVTLTVKDARGLTTSTQETVGVSPVPQPTLTIKFTTSPDPTIGWENRWIVSRQLTFDASAFNASTGFASDYSWNFGDGASATGVVVSHAYAQAGTYNVVLNVRNLEGNVQSITQQVQILPMPAAKIHVDSIPAQYRINDTITLNVMISNVTNLFAWQAGMTFNPSVLQCVTTKAPSNTVTNATETAFVEGSFLKNGGNTWWLTGSLDNNAGVIGYYGCSLYGSTFGVSGNGVLFAINFKVTGEGPLNIHLTDVVLINGEDRTEIPVYIAT